MLYYDIISVSERIGITKTNDSHESIVCHYNYSLDMNFCFQPWICNGSHDMM